MKRTLAASDMLSFGVAVLGIGMMDYAITVFLLFYYSDVLLLGTAAAGTAYFVGKAWDAVTDPFMGYLSDHTQSRLGRRRPYLFVCALPLGFSFYLLWAPILGNSQMGLCIHLLLSSMLFYTFLTMFYIPYNALGAEITPDYNERTALMGVRQGIFILGLLLGVIVPSVIAERVVDQRTGYSLVGALFGAVTALTIIITAVRVRENPAYQHRPTRLDLRQGMRETFANRPFQLLVATYILYGVATRIPSAMILFVAKYWLGMEARVPMLIAIYLVSGVLSIPLWVRFSGILGKKRTFVFALGLATAVAFSCLLLRPDALVLFSVIMALAGAGYGGLMVLSYSVLADVVDHDELHTHERREGIFFGVWDFAEKLSLALTMLLVGVILRLIGYVANQQQTPETIFGMKLVFACVPGVLYLAATALFTRFPITKSAHEEITRELAQRRASMEQVDMS